MNAAWGDPSKLEADVEHSQGGVGYVSPQQRHAGQDVTLLQAMRCTSRPAKPIRHAGAGQPRLGSHRRSGVESGEKGGRGGSDQNTKSRMNQATTILTASLSVRHLAQADQALCTFGIQWAKHGHPQTPWVQEPLAKNRQGMRVRMEAWLLQRRRSRLQRSKKRVT